MSTTTGAEGPGAAPASGSGRFGGPPLSNKPALLGGHLIPPGTHRSRQRGVQRCRATGTGGGSVKNGRDGGVKLIRRDCRVVPKNMSTWAELRIRGPGLRSEPGRPRGTDSGSGCPRQATPLSTRYGVILGSRSALSYWALCYIRVAPGWSPTRIRRTGPAAITEPSFPAD